MGDTSEESKYTDFVMYLPNDASSNYLGIGWILLYTLWNFEFFMRGFGSEFVFGAAIHLFIPFMRCLWHRKTESGLTFDFGLWLQSRSTNLWFYIAYCLVLRRVILSRNTVQFPALDNGLSLTVLSIFNLVFGIVYAIVWYCYYLPSVKATKAVAETNNAIQKV